MNTLRKRRLYAILFLLSTLGAAVALSLYALKQNINLFYTPSQVLAGLAPPQHSFRVGGMVREIRQGSGLNVTFSLTDTAQTIWVHYQGILPDLFKVGQGIVADGHLSVQGSFIADQVLAKHDEKYMPPEVSSAIKAAYRKSVKP
jgi:cytochrome c-type biogenesis protein CcmE